MRTAAAIAALLGLAACATAPDGPPPAKWALQASASAGSALILEDGQGEALRMACRRSPADLMVMTNRLRSSGAPVVLRIGEETFSLAAQGEAAGLAAVAPVPPALAATLMSGNAVSLSQDSRSIGPFTAPDQQTAAAFAIACRAAG